MTSGFGGFDNSTSKKGILNKLETVYLKLRKTEVKEVTVVTFIVNSAQDDTGVLPY